MHLTPREVDKLLIFSAGELARKRRARGLKLNHPEAVALITSEILELIRDGRSVAEIMSLGSTILGADAMNIAPSRRLYSGGGGSVRGYGYQRLGPQDVDGDPVGGRGLAEFALEARVRLKGFGGNFGIVPFLDGGSLTDKAWPGLKNWQFGAGLGVRYYSSFGPIRIDVGTPLNPRSRDSRIAVTVSLGQAF